MLNKLLGYNIEEKFPYEKQKITLLLILCIFMFCTLFFLTPYLFILGEVNSAFIVLINSFAFGIPIYLARDAEFDKAKSSFVGIYLITQILQLSIGGGFEPRQLIFLPMVGMFAILFLGKQRGFLVIGISFVVLLAFYGLDEMGISIPTVGQYDIDKNRSFLGAMIFFFIKASLIFVYNEKYNADYKSFLGDVNNRLDNAQIIGQTGSFWMNLSDGSMEFSKGLLYMFDPDLVEDDIESETDEIVKRIHPKDIDAVNIQFERALKQKEFTDVDFRVIGSNETTRHFRATGKFNEKKTSFIGVVNDVTSTKKASKNFEDYKNALDQSALVSITNRSGKIIYTNENFQKTSKYSENELLGKDHSIINSSEHDATFFRGLWTTISNGKIWRGTIKNQAKDNSHFWVDTTIIPFMDENSRPDYYMAIRFDVTEEATVSEEVLRKNKELEQFSYVLSHDLKSPLRAIKTLIHFIKEDMEDADLALPEEVEKNFDLIDGRVVRMEALIMSVLSYAQVGASKEKEWIDMNEIVKDTLEFIDVPSNIKLNISSELPQVYINRVEIKQVVQNLLTNAVKYNNNESPEIVIYPGLKKKNFLIHFKDNGQGIDERYHEKIFNLFETLKEKESFEATGIGLPIVKKIVEQAGGEITVKSTKGHGADFILKFPFSICKM